MRLNCLGSLYYFIKIALRRQKLTDQLHEPLCKFLEREKIKDLVEWPRDFYKTTIAVEGLPMWRTLPFTKNDEEDFIRLGYMPEFLRWLRLIHNPDSRNLVMSENITNAAKLGFRIRRHYESNDIYRGLFPETLPDSSCIWTNFSLHVKRSSPTLKGAHGEGTFDFLGADSALQSRHYDGLIVQDDLVGRKAIESQSVMDKTIEGHSIVPAAFEHEDSRHDGNELVIGNRWGYNDLNSHIREHEPWFRVTSHSALGGCCDAHPMGVPIFPERFGLSKLEQLKKRFGSYNFSCQYLNNPCAPEDADFKEEWLNFFSLERASDGGLYIRHEVKDGVVRRDLHVSHLALAMVTDPNHSGNAAAGRCRHAILVVAMGWVAGAREREDRSIEKTEKCNYYLLETWAKASSYDTYYNQIYQMAKGWRIRKVGFENIAAQKYAIHHLEYLNRTQPWTIRVVPLKGEVEAPDGTMSRKKEWRIRSVVAPVAEEGRLWVQKGDVVNQLDFITEYTTFPKGRYCDQLDAFAYVPQMLKHPVAEHTHQAQLAANLERMRLVNAPYSVHSVN